jgi:hypothetical protein
VQRDLDVGQLLERALRQVGHDAADDSLRGENASVRTRHRPGDHEPIFRTFFRGNFPWNIPRIFNPFSLFSLFFLYGDQ